MASAHQILARELGADICSYLDFIKDNYGLHVTLHHIEGAAKAADLELTAEEANYLEEMYVPHPLSGVMAQNKPANAKEKHVTHRR